MRPFEKAGSYLITYRESAYGNLEVVMSNKHIETGPEVFWIFVLPLLVFVSSNQFPGLPVDWQCLGGGGTLSPLRAWGAWWRSFHCFLARCIKFQGHKLALHGETPSLYFSWKVFTHSHHSGLLLLQCVADSSFPASIGEWGHALCQQLLGISFLRSCAWSRGIKVLGTELHRQPCAF